ncbi:hypothetical protein [Rudaeicoccus suwonensis]|uniref:Uncharacterized protein YydD (DUF2326 family) n=1 Tax=Rudaeicoccus suwonensis TaxID=657409 RepID=A0A561EC36_9MICO|nr:hypothetical protein [Rudaeicoccus suwonensis]TWE13172.1 uncharacterized protein YydD (DUF2326 family) [Rudaeicoccus suwonensis]
MTDKQTEAAQLHDLRLNEIDLVGGARAVTFQPGLNLVRGDITTGKTTLIRLIHALLGSIPNNLPPETTAVRAIRGKVLLGATFWNVYRPMVTTNDTPVEVASIPDVAGAESIAARLPAGGQRGYGDFLLDQLALPIVSVPRARREPTNELSPVTINDWLLYCIVTGDDLDTQVFGHRHPFRDLKRRWVFEIAYGLYDEEMANLAASLRRIDLEIRASESEAEVIRQFLAGTTIGKPDELEAQLSSQEARLAELRSQAANLGAAGNVEPGDEIGRTRTALLDSREGLDKVRAEIRQHQAQLRDLGELKRQLVSLSKRLTRSIVADEWMVDFDFVVCPRCGQDVDQHRTESPICYLCEQPEPTSAPDRDALIREQDRVTSQIAETDQLISERTKTLEELRLSEEDTAGALATLSDRLNHLTSEFVSAQAAALQSVAAETATVEANVEWIKRYLMLVDRQSDQSGYLDGLRERKLELEAQIEAHSTSVAAADDNIEALEKRVVDYLTRLHVPQLGDLLTVKINRTTYLPEVSTRTFDELSSQGLKTLVNVAHALAHHTVAIDRGLNMPGLLILDGVSANSGKEGLEGDRIVDMYKLFDEIANEYGEQLQLIIVDNDLPPKVADELSDSIVLTLSQEARLIGSPEGATEDSAAE